MTILQRDAEEYKYAGLPSLSHAPTLEVDESGKLVAFATAEGSIAVLRIQQEPSFSFSVPLIYQCAVPGLLSPPTWIMAEDVCFVGRLPLATFLSVEEGLILKNSNMFNIFEMPASCERGCSRSGRVFLWLRCCSIFADCDSGACAGDEPHTLVLLARYPCGDGTVKQQLHMLRIEAEGLSLVDTVEPPFVETVSGHPACRQMLGFWAGGIVWA